MVSAQVLSCSILRYVRKLHTALAGVSELLQKGGLVVLPGNSVRSCEAKLLSFLLNREAENHCFPAV